MGNGPQNACGHHEGSKWNFTKFLVDAQGEVVGRYGSVDTPEKIEKDVLKLI